MLPALIERNIRLSYENLIKISLTKDSCYQYLLAEDSRIVLKQIKSDFFSESDTTVEILNQWMSKYEHYPPIELIYWLHKENILLVSTYFYINKSYCNYFYNVFEEIYSQPLGDAEERISEIISQVTSALINTLKHSDDELQTFIEEIAENLIVKIVDMMENNILKKSPIADMNKYCTLNEDCIKHFAFLHLRYILSLPSDYSLTTIVEIHTKQWTSNYLPSPLIEQISEVLSRIHIQKVMDEINERVSDSSFSWKYIFVIITVLIRKCSESAAEIKRAVDGWLKQSFDEDDTNKLYLPVLVARHSCYEKARYFYSYANWFSSINLKNSKLFLLFFKFLTEILPFERPLYLKIHLNKVPSAPHGCQSLLVDYIVLAKTRLADLNESGEYIGLFNDHHETDEEGQQADIARVIAHYIENKEIAKPLLEAYILRRQYYEKVFLKQLLKVPQQDSKDRAEFIHKLHSLGKIPTSLYNAWTRL